MTKEQELQMENYYQELLKYGKIKTLNEALVFKLSYEKAFSLNGVMPMLLCLTDDVNGVTKGERYKMKNEDEEHYFLIDDRDKEIKLYKRFFEYFEQ